MNLTFDEIGHQYAIDGRPVPSVTQILRDTLGAPWAASQWHLDRGTAAHGCYHLLAQGADLALYDYDPICDPYIAGWRRWYADIQPEIIASEIRVGHPEMMYAGTADILFVLDGVLTIGDYKNSGSWQTVYQLAAYALAYEHHTKGPFIKQAAEIVIDGSGGYKMGQVIKGHEWRLAKTEWTSVRNTARIIERNAA